MQDMTVQHPLTRFRSNELDIISFTWRNADRILRQLRRFGDGMSICGDDLERQSMQMHGVDKLPDTDQTQADALAFLHSDRLWPSDSSSVPVASERDFRHVPNGYLLVAPMPLTRSLDHYSPRSQETRGTTRAPS